MYDRFDREDEYDMFDWLSRERLDENIVQFNGYINDEEPIIYGTR